MGNASGSESRGSGFDKSTKTFRSSKPDVVSGVGRRSPAELLQFNLSQPVASVVIGCEQLAPLEQNVQAALNFTPICQSGSARGFSNSVRKKKRSRKDELVFGNF
jgi:hypothetical protein